MTTLSDLLLVPAKDAVLDALVALARLAGFPTASWQPGSVARTLFESESSTLADLTAVIRDIAKGGFLDDATGGWLTLLAKARYQEDRKASVFTEGTVVLTAAAGAGPYTITPGQYWVANADASLRFMAMTGGTLPAGGSLPITVRGESPGAAWNVAPGAITRQTTPFAGVTATNPIGPNGTWVTTQGADEESDESLRQRCRDKWATLGNGSTEAAFRYWAASAAAEITRVRVDTDPDSGSVYVTVAGASGPASTAGATAAATAVDTKRPLTVRAVVTNAYAASPTIRATVYMRRGYTAAAILAAVQAAVDAYARTVPIGGTAWASRIVAAMQGVPGVDFVRVTSPTDSIALASDRVLVPLYALTAVYADGAA